MLPVLLSGGAVMLAELRCVAPAPHPDMVPGMKMEPGVPLVTEPLVQVTTPATAAPQEKPPDVVITPVCVKADGSVSATVIPGTVPTLE